MHVCMCMYMMGVWVTFWRKRIIINPLAVHIVNAPTSVTYHTLSIFNSTHSVIEWIHTHTNNLKLQLNNNYYLWSPILPRSKKERERERWRGRGGERGGRAGEDSSTSINILIPITSVTSPFLPLQVYLPVPLFINGRSTSIQLFPSTLIACMDGSILWSGRVIPSRSQTILDAPKPPSALQLML